MFTIVLKHLLFYFLNKKINCKIVIIYYRIRSHSKRPKRVDVTKLPPTDLDNGPPNKAARNNVGPGIIRGELDPNSSDHVVAMTQLKEQIASLQKQINQKDAQLLSKDKMVRILVSLLCVVCSICGNFVFFLLEICLKLYTGCGLFMLQFPHFFCFKKISDN